MTWDLFEPEEGAFDYAIVDALIQQARRRGGKLGLLWFGAWKNAQCYYAPEWVKADTSRFRRAEAEPGKTKVILRDFHNFSYTTLSAFCEATRKADANAFAHLMAHVAEVDGADHTVVFVQVENEVGLQGAARDHCAEANTAFEEPVSEGLVAYLCEHEEGLAPDVRAALADGQSSGTWEEVFGAYAEEAFQTYYTARYIESVAEAGKAEYPLPMVANCWLDKGHRPGRFPCGGPVARDLEIWRFAAPSIEASCPDIYLPAFCDTCDSYRKLGNPLFVVETATHAYAAPRLIWAVGHHHAPCFAPFGFEEMGQPFSSDIGILFGMDTSDPALRTPQDVGEYRAVTQALEGLLSISAMPSRRDAVTSECGPEQVLDAGGFELAVRFSQGKPGACMVLRAGRDEAFVLAMNCGIDARSKDPEKPNLDYLAVEDGRVRDGTWVRDRRLNGDELMNLMRLEGPQLLRLKVVTYA